MDLKLEAKHELNLAWQPGTSVRGDRIVVVVVEVVCRSDQTGSCHRLKHPSVGYRVSRTIGRLNIIEGKIVGAGIPELRVIEDVEYLHPKLQGNALSKLGFLHECEVYLPGV